MEKIEEGFASMNVGLVTSSKAKHMSGASKTDVQNLLAASRFAGVTSVDVSKERRIHDILTILGDITPFSWNTTTETGTLKLQETHASESLREKLQGLISSVLNDSVQLVKAGQVRLNVKFNRVKGQDARSANEFNGYSDFGVVPAHSANGPDTVAAMNSILLLDWKTPKAIKKVSTILGIGVYQLVGFVTLTRRSAPVVITDLASGIRIFNLEGSDLQELLWGKQTLTLEQGIATTVWLIERRLLEFNEWIRVSRTRNPLDSIPEYGTSEHEDENRENDEVAGDESGGYGDKENSGVESDIGWGNSNMEDLYADAENELRMQKFHQIITNTPWLRMLGKAAFGNALN